MKENKKSMTQNFIDNWVDDYEQNLREITENQYNELYNKKLRSEYFYEQDIYHNYDHPAHPLLKVHIIKELHYSYPSGSYDWDFRFIFKYKGKYYMFIDEGGT